jgi:alpha-mannosidase
MMLAYNLFLLFKMDFPGEAIGRQQIKTFRLKYIFLARKIIKTARSVVMKLSDRYPYREMYEYSLSA